MINPYRSLTEEANSHEFAEGRDNTRRKYLPQEGSVRSIAALFSLGCALLIWLGFGVLINSRDIGWKCAGVAILSVAVLFGVTSIGLFARNERSRKTAVVISIACLAAFPVGTIFSAYVMSQLLKTESRYVFTNEYFELVRATPRLKPRTSYWVWFLTAVFIVMCARALSSYVSEIM